MLRIVQLDHIVLYARDMAAMLAFYEGVLGCERVREIASIGLVQLRAGASLIDLIEARGAATSPEAPRPNLEHFCLTLEAYDEAQLRGHCAAHGVPVGESGARFGAEGEGPSLYLYDPEGNKLELKAPPWPAATDGEVMAHQRMQAALRAPRAAASAPVVLRTLCAGDAPAYAALRLRMLAEHPEAFGSSEEEEGRLSVAQFARRLSAAGDPPERLVFGAFEPSGILVGSACLIADRRPKERHRVHIVAFYVLPALRGAGLGRRLMLACLEAARARAGTEIILLRVTSGNDIARRLYTSLGFVTYGIEPNALHVNGLVLDTELMAYRLAAER